MVEDTFNEYLAKSLERRRRAWQDNPDLIACQRTHVVEDNSRKQIDVLVRSPDAPPIAIEVEWDDPAVDDARGRIGKHVQGSALPIRSAIAIGVPQEVRNWGTTQLQEALETPGEVPLRFVMLYSSLRGDEPAGRPLRGADITRWPTDAFVSGTVDDLARLCEYATAPPALVSEMAREVAARITSIAAELQTHRRAAAAIARRLGQEDVGQGLRLACCIWLTSLRLQSRLAEQSDALSEVGLRTVAQMLEGSLGRRVTAAAAREEWEKILSVNYGAIFNTARSSLHAGIPDGIASEALTSLARMASEISAARLGNRLDFAGELFPELLEDREETAAHYTLPITAELLAGLAVDRLPIHNWSDTDELSSVRIADFACGTGALLRAVYGHIRHYCEAGGGRISDLHRAFMEDCLTGIDINALAIHMTASGLSSSGIQDDYERSNIASVSVNDGQTGSLELLERDQITDMVGGAYFDAAPMDDDPSTITVSRGSQDMVIQNPPYLRPRSDRKLFDVAGIEEGERQRSLQRLGQLRKQERRKGSQIGHGQAGLAADFCALADSKLKPGGVLATVLPLTAAHAESWTGFRRALGERYQDIMAIAFTGHEAEMMSADTLMEEMLLIATKRKEPSPPGARADVLCLNLSRPPQSLAESFWYRKLIAEASVQDDAHGVIHIGGRIGSWVRADVPIPGFPWFAVGMRNHDLASATARLLAGELVSPQDRSSWNFSIPMASLGQIVDVGPTHHLIGHVRGNEEIGAFAFDKIEHDIPTYPALWSASKRQDQLLLPPTHSGEPQGGDTAEVEAMLGKRSTLFISRTLRLTSQALAVARTESPMMGGRAWTALLSDDEAVRAALAIWCNSTLGLMLRAAYAQTTQPGRATMQVRALSNFPVPDFTVPTEGGDHARGVALRDFPLLQALTLRPAALASTDESRKRIDEAALDMLGLGDSAEAAVALDFLRRSWVREPAVHGGKKGIMKAVGVA